MRRQNSVTAPKLGQFPLAWKSTATTSYANFGAGTVAANRSGPEQGALRPTATAGLNLIYFLI